MIKRLELSATQKKILRTLIFYVEKNRCQPSYAELAELCDRVSVQREIDRIAACGWLRITGLARAIEIPEDVYKGILAEGEKDHHDKKSKT
jgi:hypothetical protein